VSGNSGSWRPARTSGWSETPFAARLPAIAIVAVIGLAAVVRETAPIVFVGILFGYLLMRQFRTPSTVLAAVLPAAAILVWRSLPQPVTDATGLDCVNLVAPPAVWRLLEAAVGLAAVGALLLDRKGSPGELGFRRGSRRVRALAFAALIIVTPLSLYVATLVGQGRFGLSVFGDFALDFSQPIALVPALVFAASNALAEELAYRGAMRTWLTPSLGVVGANLAQAIVFGLAHTGEDFVGIEAAIPTMIAMVAVGYIGGIVARRTGSLTLLLAIHAAADIPIYFYYACRVG
jgi:membrane protease YdiL (CAAX protease family)